MRYRLSRRRRCNVPREIACLFMFLFLVAGVCAQEVPREQGPDTSVGDALVTEYIRLETAALSESALKGIETLDDWEARRGEYRRQLLEMLGLDPLPERTPLEATVTGTIDRERFRVEKVCFQSRPGLYVTGNLYVPKRADGPLPAVLYVCGHASVKDEGVSFGNKTAYQHHGVWFARHGYVCLTIDTLQLGEIEGIHHGTYNRGMWSWNCRGYTPAGVEAWNCIRALDYLETRAEVDPARMGVTGRSGGGAYSWWIAAIDERIQCAVPVAGITSLHNHVVDGCVEGHCDCMYFVNTYRWDFPLVAAMVAPRPLLISNSDKDRIFPLDGVVDVYTKAKRIYELYDATDRFGLQITEGPHRDTQELRVHAFVWFNRFLKGEEELIDEPAVKVFEPAELKVFDELPEDERNTEIQETFVPVAHYEAASTAGVWNEQREAWLAALKERVFRGWPAEIARGGSSLSMREMLSMSRGGVTLSAYEFESQTPYRLRLYVAHAADRDPGSLELTVLNVLDQRGWEEFSGMINAGLPAVLPEVAVGEEDTANWNELAGMLRDHAWGMAWMAPRGVGPTEWSREERAGTQIRRRFMLLGQTADGMRVWDVRRAIQAFRQLPGVRDVPLWLQGERDAAGWALYASLFEPDVVRLDLWSLPHSHRNGPIFLNVLRFLDVPQAVALAAERSRIRIYDADAGAWQFPLELAERLNWDPRQIKVRPVPAVPVE